MLTFNLSQNTYVYLWNLLISEVILYCEISSKNNTFIYISLLESQNVLLLWGLHTIFYYMPNTK